MNWVLNRLALALGLHDSGIGGLFPGIHGSRLLEVQGMAAAEGKIA